MRAMDVMLRDVVTASPNEDVDQVIELLAKHDASTLPVVDAEGNVVGMIGDLDLMRRPEIGGDRHRKTPSVVDGGHDPGQHAGRGICQIARPARG